MATPKGADHPYNRLQTQFWNEADKNRELQKELAETRATAVMESNLREYDQAQLKDTRERLQQQVARHQGYQEGTEAAIKLLLRCDEQRKGMGLSALFG
jgi:N-acetyl-beta-hexosaminidase